MAQQKNCRPWPDALARNVASAGCRVHADRVRERQGHAGGSAAQNTPMQIDDRWEPTEIGAYLHSYRGRHHLPPEMIFARMIETGVVV